MAKTYSQKGLIEGIHAGEYSKFNLPRDLFEFTYNELVEEVEKVFGEKISFPEDDEREEIVKSLKANLAQFSGAKTFTEVNEISKFLFDSEGFKLSFKDFQEIVKPIDDKFNKVWLKTEQDTSFGQSQSADSWLQYEKEKDIFPLLKYQTADDERVRHEHAAWDNKVFPVDHEFWDTRMPLNGYNCRCRVIQLREGKESTFKGVQENTDKQFQKNPGKSGEIFTKKHPYFKVKRGDKNLTRNNYGLGEPS